MLFNAVNGNGNLRITIFAPFNLKYEGAGHQIRVPGGPQTVRTLRLRVEGASADLLDMGGTGKADAEAGLDAWRSVLEFLESGLKDRR